jgi:hypothetical protein
MSLSFQAVVRRHSQNSRRHSQNSPDESELHELHISLPDDDVPDSDSIRVPDNDESEYRVRSSNIAAATSDAPECSLLPLEVEPLPASSESSRPLSDAARSARVLFHQLKGFPPPSTLSVPPNQNRFKLLCSPKNLLRKLGCRIDSGIMGSGSLDGFEILYDRNTASIPGLHLPLALDMVRDGAKNRLLNVLGFACIFCSVILILASFIFVAPQAPIPNKVLSFCVTSNLCSLIIPPVLLASDRPS